MKALLIQYFDRNKRILQGFSMVTILSFSLFMVLGMNSIDVPVDVIFVTLYIMIIPGIISLISFTNMKQLSLAYAAISMVVPLVILTPLLGMYDIIRSFSDNLGYFIPMIFLAIPAQLILINVYLWYRMSMKQMIIRLVVFILGYILLLYLFEYLAMIYENSLFTLIYNVSYFYILNTFCLFFAFKQHDSKGSEQ
ncbi:MAG: hypothetical protein UMR38_01375 [Candidatus Izemoplasma sp.]|nr:hypothetical protein [Candidatus Izemoplasma sp.]